MTKKRELSRKEKNQRKKTKKRRSREALAKWQEERGIHEFAKNLKENLPDSEKWFLELFSKVKLGIYLDNNKVIDYYIPDFVYQTLIIEVDDPTHEKPEQIIIDKKKDKFYKSKGYTVIRVKAWCITSFNECVKRIREYLKNLAKARKKKVQQKLNNPTKKRTQNQLDKAERNRRKPPKKHRCHLCKKANHTTVIKYKGKSFKVCLSCKKKHTETMKLINK